MDSAIKRMIDQFYIDRFEELVQQMAGGSKQNS
jgi:hypothetical protein